MNAPSLSAARAELAAALAVTGYPSTSYVPEQAEPPLLVVVPAEDYVTVDGTTYDVTDFLASVDVFVLADYRSNEQAANTLDTMLTLVLPALLDSGWTLSGSGAPGPYTAGDWVCHGIRLTVNRYVNIDPTPN